MMDDLGRRNDKSVTTAYYSKESEHVLRCLSRFSNL